MMIHVQQINETQMSAYLYDFLSQGDDLKFMVRPIICKRHLTEILKGLPAAPKFKNCLTFNLRLAHGVKSLKH